MADQVRVSESQFAEKWARRLVQATPDIRMGVDRVTESPMEKAADQQDKMLANITRSIQSGKWARGLRRRTLAEWKDRTVNVGINRIPAGVEKAKSDVQDFARDLINHENAGLSRLQGMPDTTLEDSINRATTWIRHMADFERS